MVDIVYHCWKIELFEVGQLYGICFVWVIIERVIVTPGASKLLSKLITIIKSIQTDYCVLRQETASSGSLWQQIGLLRESLNSSNQKK